MEAPDFSGWATKAGLKCTDGRTIMPDAFSHQNELTVPLVWQHGHTDPENVLGHAVLHSRDGSVYTSCYFNKTKKARHAAEAVSHKDITQLSIWANNLVQHGGEVIRGAIREVSLVLAGANPGALIETVTIRHSADDLEALEDEAVIYTGIPIVHGDIDSEAVGDAVEEKPEESEDEKPEESEDEKPKDPEEEESEESEEKSEEPEEEESEGSVEEIDPEVAQHVIDGMSAQQQDVLNQMVESARKFGQTGEITHAVTADTTLQDVIDTMNEDQRNVFYYAVTKAAALADVKHDSVDDGNTTKGSEMHRNVFDTTEPTERIVLEHDAMKGVMASAEKLGSLKDSVDAYALQHNITDIDLLFPDAVALQKTPEFLSRRTEWVAKVLDGAQKSPFSRIKTLHADITEEQARAKGYVTGDFKKEEFFSVSRRVTTPTTVYKKQVLDRDDVVDITDFDVVAWLKAEMRLMLDEEIARAVLVGDGRDIAHDDKINEQNIRPIATDHDLYTTKLYVNISDASSSAEEIIDALIGNRYRWKGSGSPSLFVSEETIARFLLIKDTLGRRIYNTLADVAAVLRVKEIVPVEILGEPAYDDMACILVNMADYVMGATAGGKVSMFDDFDIDYNKQKYLIETRMSGALTKLKSALVVHLVTGTLVTPNAPTFSVDQDEVTIVATTNVVYTNADTDAVMTVGSSPYAVAPGTTLRVHAAPSSASYYFASSEVDDWSFTNPPA